jgi:CRP/FNR family cyclic AMP-dependent transcriptional regulator
VTEVEFVATALATKAAAGLSDISRGGFYDFHAALGEGGEHVIAGAQVAQGAQGLTGSAALRKGLDRQWSAGGAPSVVPERSLLVTMPERSGRRGTHVTVPSGPAEWPTRSLLGRLSPPARRELLDLGTEVRFDADAVLLRQGMNDRHVLLLLSGLTKVTAVVENGETSLLAVRAGGDTVGEMAAMDGSAPRSATVTTCGPLTARMLTDGVLRELLVRRPEVSMALTAVVADRLRWANRRRLEFRGYPVKTRLARALVELAASYETPRADGVVIEIRLTQPELATLVGAAETTVHKVLRELREEDLVETRYRATVIRDLPRLRRLADLADE